MTANLRSIQRWKTTDSWLSSASEVLAADGVFVVEGVVDRALLAATRETMYRVHERIRSDVGSERRESWASSASR
jgi:hypothetical protein